MREMHTAAKEAYLLALRASDVVVEAGGSDDAAWGGGDGEDAAVGGGGDDASMTDTGIELEVWLPSPSCPLSLLPQHLANSSVSRAHEW